MPHIQSSNLVVARSTRAGGASLINPMEEEYSIEFIQLLLTRLERISADSIWAHQASGLRGALIKTLDKLDNGQSGQIPNLDALVEKSFSILEMSIRDRLR
jgi:hypothetical protein